MLRLREPIETSCWSFAASSVPGGGEDGNDHRPFAKMPNFPPQSPAKRLPHATSCPFCVLPAPSSPEVQLVPSPNAQDTVVVEPLSLVHIASVPCGPVATTG